MSVNKPATKVSARAVGKAHRRYIRADRKKTFNLESNLAKMAYINGVIGRDKDSKNRHIRDAILEREAINDRAHELFTQYGEVATWAACVQAVKTNWLSGFVNKYSKKLTDKRNMERR